MTGRGWEAGSRTQIIKVIEVPSLCPSIWRSFCICLVHLQPSLNSRRCWLRSVWNWLLQEQSHNGTVADWTLYKKARILHSSMGKGKKTPSYIWTCSSWDSHMNNYYRGCSRKIRNEAQRRVIFQADSSINATQIFMSCSSCLLLFVSGDLWTLSLIIAQTSQATKLEGD